MPRELLSRPLPDPRYRPCTACYATMRGLAWRLAHWRDYAPEPHAPHHSTTIHHLVVLRFNVPTARIALTKEGSREALERAGATPQGGAPLKRAVLGLDPQCRPRIWTPPVKN